MNYLYDAETILNELPQRNIAKTLHNLIFKIINDDKAQESILVVEKYFRNMIKKIEQYYCRRLQKLEYFLIKKVDYELLIQRISKYQVKKPWHIDGYDYKRQKILKQDDKNCNQLIDIIHEDKTSKTSTPFSHYSQIPSYVQDNSLNQAIYLDEQFSLEFDDQLSIDINYLQEQLELIASRNKIHNPQLADIDDLTQLEFLEKDFSDIDKQDLELSDIKLQKEDGMSSNHQIESARSFLHFDKEEDQFLQEIEKEQDKVYPSKVDSPKQRELFETKQSTKEIIKYVEQYQKDQREYNSFKNRDFQRPTIMLFDRIQSPCNRRYRVKSSYQKELPQLRLKSNVSHDNFDARTLSTKSKQRQQQIPMVSPQQIQTKKVQITTSNIYRFAKKQSTRTKQPSYSIDKIQRVEERKRTSKSIY
ncbi:hypothetical protein pb186bvf_014064 [Paramecium bursaria]